MIGTLNDKHPEAVIIGAGFAGLLAAHRLLQRGWKISLYDAAPRAGGLIQTTQTEYGIADGAAHTIRSSRAMDALFAELKLEAVTARTKKKYIWRDGDMKSFPLKMGEAAELAARAAFMPARAHYETLQEWALHHAGRAALDNLFYPMLNGIYAASTAELSPQLVFPKLVPTTGKTLLSQALSSRKNTRYKTRVMAPRAGMQALTDALFHSVEKNPDAKVFLGERVTQLPDAPNVIVTVPAAAASSLLRAEFPASAAALSALTYAPMICATVFLRRRHHVAPTGIGVLCAANQNRQSMGILFNSSSFEGRVADEANVASYTVMLGGTQNPGIMNFSDEALRQIIITELQAMVNLSADPLEIILHRWPAAIPVYSPQLVGAHRILRSDFCAQPGRVIFGNYTGQISLRGMVDSF